MSLETSTEARCCQQDLQVRSAAYPRGAVVIIVAIIIIMVIITIIVTIVIIVLIIVISFVIIVRIIVVIIVISLKKGAWAPKLVGPNVGLGFIPIPDPQK